MALPEQITYGYVTGNLLSLVPGIESSGAEGTVVFSPRTHKLVAANTIVTLEDSEFPISATGELGTVKLVSTDNVEVSPVDWTYRVFVNLNGQCVWSFDMSIPAGTTQDLADDIPVSSSDGVPVTRGPHGESATIEVGTVGTVPPGNPATVANSGTIYDAVLDFQIPRGFQGPVTVGVGTVTTLAEGTSATVSNSGTEEDVTLDFGIPRGDTGPVSDAEIKVGQVTATSPFLRVLVEGSYYVATASTVSVRIGDSVVISRRGSELFILGLANGPGQPPFLIDAGSVHITAKGGMGKQTVQFKTSFTAVPNITLTAWTGAFTVDNVQFESASTTGFVAILRRSNSVGTTVHWNAIQMLT